MQLFQQFDASGDDFGQQFEYQNGYTKAVWEARYGRNNPNSVRYQLLEAMDAYGNVTQSQAGNGRTHWRSHDAKTGLINTITTSGQLQQWTYAFDGLGNLRSRKDELHRLSALSGSGTQAFDEQFSYDALNRLSEVRQGGSVSLALSYANNGNILTKSDVQGGATYTYGTKPSQCSRTPGPRAVSQIGTQRYCYDAMGNQTHQYNNSTLVRQIDYNAIGKASRIVSHGSETDSGRTAGTTQFIYDGSRNQVYRHSTEQGKTTTIVQQGGVELVIEGSERRFRRNLGNAIVERSGSTITTRYVYTDHLGSVDVITNAIGQLVEKLSFDAFGKRRAVFNQSGQSIALNLSTLLAITHQGFTGHQQVDHAGIVQMGGRIYDSHVGRFLQADPFVQSPSNSQNFNRYSYVLNNPLSYTDPSGYFHNPLKKIGRGIIRGAVKVFGADVVNFVGSAVSMFYGGAWGAAAWNYEFNRAMGASSSAAFKSAAIAGASAFAFSQIGSYYQGVGEAGTGTINFGGNMLTSGQIAGQITAHAMVGGVAASLQGGKFGHGFFSAGVTKGLGGRFLPGGPELSGSEVVYGTVVSAMIGGTASVVAGGKFANGARTASMQYLMNQAARAASRYKKTTVYGKASIATAGYGNLAYARLDAELQYHVYSSETGELLGTRHVSLTVDLTGMEVGALPVTAVTFSFTMDGPDMMNQSAWNAFDGKLVTIDGFTASFGYGFSIGNIAIGNFVGNETFIPVTGLDLGWYGGRGMSKVNSVKFTPYYW